MRLLIDACLPVELKEHFPGVEAMTTRDMGWQRLKNGELLARAQGSFGAFLTIDKSIPSQQSLANLSIAVLVVRARSNRIGDLLPLIPKVAAALPLAKPGTATVIS